MAPQPSLRCSPARELKTEVHRRGRSLESFRVKDKDDDLALFNDMHSKERDNFLHHSGDESDESLSVKLRDFSSNFRINVSTPNVKDKSDLLLTNDAEKTDYDWLLTPPDTPLFPSLDEETPPSKLLQRGRRRAQQPIRISTASRAETNARGGSSRSSASPQRSSPGAVTTSHGRRASPSPSPSLRSTPTPTSKPSSFRSTTPTLKRSNTANSRIASAPGSSSSAAKPSTSRGKSASPKLQSWHSSHPEFTAEAPPNLRTCIGDMPVSRTRGSSPASSRGLSPVSRRGLSPVSTRGLSPVSTRGLSPVSRHGSDTGAGSNSRRQSVSPTTRSVCSSTSHDRDQLSSQSKGSAVSSCDDEMDSLQSKFSGKKRAVSPGMLGRQSTRKQEPFPNSSRINSFSRKPIRSTSAIHMPSASSAVAKRPFDATTIRQMDLHRNSQSMFRPLLSSVPTTSFYTSKINGVQSRQYSMTSSVTTSSNASSEHGASVVPDTEGSEHDQDEDGSSVVDKTVVKSEDAQFDTLHIDGKKSDVSINTQNVASTLNIHIDAEKDSNISELRSKSKNSSMDAGTVNIHTVMEDVHADQNQRAGISYSEDHPTQLESFVLEGTELDRKTIEATVMANNDVGSRFVDIQMDVAGSNQNPQKNGDTSGASSRLLSAKGSETEGKMRSNSCWNQGSVSSKSLGKQDSQATGVLSLQQSKLTARQAAQCSSVPGQHLVDCETRSLQDVHVQHSSRDNESTAENISRDKSSYIRGVSPEGSPGRFSSDCKIEFCHRNVAPTSHLVRTSSSKWPSVHSKSSINSDSSDQSAAQLRQTLHELRMLRNEENISNSATISNSSIAKQMEIRMSRQSSSKSVDTANSGSNSNFVMASGTPPLTSGASSDVNLSVSRDKNVTQQGDPVSFTDVFETRDNRHTESGCQTATSERLAAQDGYGDIDLNRTSKDHSLISDKGAEKTLSGNITNDHCYPMDLETNGGHSVTKNIDVHNYAYTSDQESENTYQNSDPVISGDHEQDKEATEGIHEALSVAGDSSVMDNLTDEDKNQQSSADTLQAKFECVEMESTTVADKISLEIVTESSTSQPSEEYSGTQCLKTESTNDVPVEGTQKADASRSYLSRNFTLEEATDTILFCSSIVHDLAYKAVNIATEKGNQFLEPLRPAITASGKSQGDHRPTCARSAGRRTSRFHKIRSRQTAAHLQAPSNNIETNVKGQEAVMQVVSISEKAEKPNPPVKLSSENSKCNCTVM